jgi:threonine synthase
MQLYSTQDPSGINSKHTVSFEEAVFQSMPADNGLFMPTHFPQLPPAFFQKITDKSFAEISYEVAYALLSEEIPSEVLKGIVEETVNFEAPIVALNQQIYVLELFHGPTLAFKDFGARFMARIMSWFLQERKDQEEVTILVATSGDTGGAVAQGFFNVPGIKVVLLYPKGKVSELQEKQLTTLGGNITALEVDGTFDDCQHLVKQAFLDTELRKAIRMASANSINISRLIPQSFYYFNTYAQLKREPDFDENRPLVFSVPSGNFGNLCGGMIAIQMGLPVHQMIATTNINDIVPAYLTTGLFTPKPSVRTLSNAMDVGNPSNFARLQAFYEQQGFHQADKRLHAMAKDIVGKSYTDEATKAAIREMFVQYNYTACPHTAVGYLGLRDYLKTQKIPMYGVVLSTAHPAKFVDIVEEATEKTITLPESLHILLHRNKQAVSMPVSYPAFKAFLLN